MTIASTPRIWPKEIGPAWVGGVSGSVKLKSPSAIADPAVR